MTRLDLIEDIAFMHPQDTDKWWWDYPLRPADKDYSLQENKQTLVSLKISSRGSLAPGTTLASLQEEYKTLCYVGCNKCFCCKNCCINKIELKRNVSVLVYSTICRAAEEPLIGGTSWGCYCTMVGASAARSSCYAKNCTAGICIWDLSLGRAYLYSLGQSVCFCSTNKAAVSVGSC